MKEVLKALCNEIGPSGFEQDVQRLILKTVRPYVDQVIVDALGNLIVKKAGNSDGYPSLLMAAHADEIGFIVKKIEENGLIRFEEIGGFDDRILLSEAVWIKAKSGRVRGVIGTLATHYVKWDDPQRVTNHRDLYIDVGARSKKEVEALGVEVGQPISYGTGLHVLGNDSTRRLTGKSLDDRSSCAVLIELLQDLGHSNAKHGDLYAAFTVQEEVGLRGASVVAAAVRPDFALAVDTTPASDTGESLMGGTRLLGNGPCIKVMDKSVISHPLVVNQFKRLAQKYKIPHQIEIFMGIGTDAGALHVTGSGISSGVLSIPSRFTHTPHETVDLDDMTNTLKLLTHFMLSLNELKGKNFLDT